MTILHRVLGGHGGKELLALRVVAERIEHGEKGPELLSISFLAA